MDSWPFSFNPDLNLIDFQWSFIQNNVLILIGSLPTQQGKCADAFQAFFEKSMYNVHDVRFQLVKSISAGCTRLCDSFGFPGRT